MSDKKEDLTGPFFDAFRSFGQNLKLPTITIEDVVSHHKANIRALEEAAQNTSKSAQEIMSAQRKALENTLADITHMVQDARDGGLNKENAREVINDQIELSKRTFETTIQQASEIGNIVQETSKDNLEILKNRMQGSIEELKSVMDRRSEDGSDDEPPIKAG